MTIALICVCVPCLLAIGFFGGRIYEANLAERRHFEAWPDHAQGNPFDPESR